MQAVKQTEKNCLFTFPAKKNRGQGKSEPEQSKYQSNVRLASDVTCGGRFQEQHKWSLLLKTPIRSDRTSFISSSSLYESDYNQKHKVKQTCCNNYVYSNLYWDDDSPWNKIFILSKNLVREAGSAMDVWQNPHKRLGQSQTFFIVSSQMSNQTIIYCICLEFL